MQEIDQGAALQTAYRTLFHRYGPHLTTAATLTLKQSARIAVPRFENVPGEYFYFQKPLDDEAINSTLSRFDARLTHYLYGHQARHRNKKHWAKPLLIVSIEGRKTHKLTHVHAAIGNIPQDKQADIASIIAQAWHDCDFGNRHVCVKPLTDARGWLDYISKEVGYTDNDAMDVEHMSIPEIIERSI